MPSAPPTALQQAERSPAAGPGHDHAVPDGEALAVAMALAPGVYARNRHYALYADPRVKKARARAAQLRGLARQLSGKEGPLDQLRVERGTLHVRLRYKMARLRLSRTAELTPVEAACIFQLASKAGATGLTPTAEDGARLAAALRRLGSWGPAHHPDAPDTMSDSDTERQL